MATVSTRRNSRSAACSCNYTQEIEVGAQSICQDITGNLIGKRILNMEVSKNIQGAKTASPFI